MVLTIGEILRKTREDKGISLADVENETKIRRKYIQALENDDFNVLPGRVYVKGFLRSYARYLDLDGEEMVRQYEELYGERSISEQSPEIPVETIIKQPAKSRRGFFVVTAVLVMVVIVYVWGITGAGQNDDIPDIKNKQNMLTEDSSGNNARSENTNAEDNNNSVDNPVEKGINMVLDITDGDCWMHVIVDDRDTFQGLVKSGNTKEFHGEKSVWMKLGDAGAVRVQVNGNDYGFLGNRGEVVTRVFRADENEGNAVGG